MVLPTIPADFYAYVLPFLFVLAVAHFVLGTVIKQQSARALLSIVLAMLVLFNPAAPALGMFLSQMGLALAVVITLGMICIIFMTALGHDATVFTQHTKYLAPIGLVFGVAIFIAAGGLNLLGLEMIIPQIDMTWVILIAVIIIAVWILTIEPKAAK